jgi:hypothetical protein
MKSKTLIVLGTVAAAIASTSSALAVVRPPVAVPDSGSTALLAVAGVLSLGLIRRVFRKD